MSRSLTHVILTLALIASPTGAKAEPAAAFRLGAVEHGPRRKRKGKRW